MYLTPDLILPPANMGCASEPPKAHQPAGPVNRLVSAELAYPALAVKEMLRVVGGFRYSDLRVGSHQLLLGFPDVGPPLQQTGRKSGRHLWQDAAARSASGRARLDQGCFPAEC